MLENLSDQEFQNLLQKKVKQERQLSVEIIDLLQETERRKLYLHRGFGSLIEFCVKQLGYSESAAFRRIQAMRISAQVPEIKTALVEGRLSMVNISKAQTLFKAEARINKPFTADEKREVIKELENKTQYEAEKILATKSETIFVKERLRPTSDQKTQLSIVIDDQLLGKLNKIRSLLSHKSPTAGYAEIIDHMANLALAKLDPARETKPRRASTPQRSHYQRFVSAETKRRVWRRAEGKCSHQDIQSGKRCESTFQLEIDHIVPVAKGGGREFSNLRLLCRAHNQHFSRLEFGDRWTLTNPALKAAGS